ncbi:hypothetical protein BSK71_07755 [Pectobacterium actinidiae]|uniref:Uncharacterized protein n=1 Tax=Pectobacterium actinidiae TaxID=1507808 RepID=A0A1V2R5X8_9GAMM|nr:hypothetical protein [Pectobacterium actinidiae]KHN91529.1 hypothetical protein KKH3_15560 [Pectobacterium actinidiae]ONK04944.1 hypothetical protein BSK69_07475 [Pectobacterium actinidiae]ONK07566.1 hypothetical protein BSK71_07755 [Pectobacterium actinidiae]
MMVDNVNYQFGRDYLITISSSSSRGTLTFAPPMQVIFSVSHTPGNKTGKAKITIYGTSKGTRWDIFNKYDTVEIKAGYQGNCGLIYRGQIFNRSTQREGVATTLTLYCFCNGKKMSSAFIAHTWGENTPAIEIIRGTAATFGLPMEIIGDFSDLPPAIQGKTLMAMTKDAMDALERIYDFKWWLKTDGVAIIRNGAEKPGKPRVIDINHGMEGIPRIYMNYVEVDVRLDHVITPGDVIQVYSEHEQLGFSEMYRTNMQAYSRAFRNKSRLVVESVDHIGNFWRDDWTTTITARMRSNEVIR